MTTQPPKFCPALVTTMILPKRLKLVPLTTMKVGPGEVKATGQMAIVTVGVQNNLSMSALDKNPGLAHQIPSTQQLPVPIPMVPYEAYVEYEAKDGTVSAELEDAQYKSVSITPACQKDRCEAWDSNAAKCRIYH